MDCLVTLDAGTGSGRCVVFDARGRPLAAAQEAFRYRSFTDPAVPFVRGFDLDAPAFWQALARCCRTALAALPHGARIRGVIATAQREGCVFLDAAGEVLYAGPNLDARAAAEGMEVMETLGPRLHRITGHAPAYIFALARYQWFRKHRRTARVATLLMLNDWITYLLSGARGAEPSNASESMLYDVSERAWSEEILAAMDIPRDILPVLRETGACVGRVTPAAAAATGLPEGTPVFVGGADTESALLGSGVAEDGQTGAVLGTTTPVQMVTARPIIDPAGNLWTSCHVVPGRWVLESNAGDTGGAYRWLLELFFGASDARAHAAAEAEMASAEQGARPVVSHLGPAVFNLGNMNPFQPAGLLFRFPLLHVDRPQRGEILQSFVDNVAFAIRGNLEQIAAVAGRPVEVLHVSGGLTRSPTMLRTLAVAVGVPIEAADVAETASLGSAILAAVGAGVHPALADAVAAMTHSRRIEPDLADHAAVEERYGRWRQVYETLRAWSL